MLKLKWLLLPLGALSLFSVQCHPIGPPSGGRDTWTAPQPKPNPGSPAREEKVTVNSMLKRANVQTDMVKRGRFGRRLMKPMNARYITIHSTQNKTADAQRHAVALKNGALRTGSGRGYIIWHFTVDDRRAVQHMPTSEQGIHADVDGPGNRTSIGIEMCEFRGCNRAATVDRTAKLTAALMVRNHIPLRNVVPHYRWPRRGMSPVHKNCPHFLLDNGRPGKTWQRFLGRVDYYYKQIKEQ